MTPSRGSNPTAKQAFSERFNELDQVPLDGRLRAAAQI